MSAWWKSLGASAMAILFAFIAGLVAIYGSSTLVPVGVFLEALIAAYWGLRARMYWEEWRAAPEATVWEYRKDRAA